MINVEFDVGGELTIIVDKDGATKLREYLTSLIDGKETHYHLMTPSWGGNDLDEKIIEQKSKLVNQVRIQIISTK